MAHVSAEESRGIFFLHFAWGENLKSCSLNSSCGSCEGWISDCVWEHIAFLLSMWKCSTGFLSNPAIGTR